MYIVLILPVDLCLEMSSDFNYNFGFVVEEIFELGHTIKSRCFACERRRSRSQAAKIAGRRPKRKTLPEWNASLRPTR